MNIPARSKKLGSQWLLWVESFAWNMFHFTLYALHFTCPSRFYRFSLQAELDVIVLSYNIFGSSENPPCLKSHVKTLATSAHLQMFPNLKRNVGRHFNSTGFVRNLHRPAGQNPFRGQRALKRDLYYTCYLVFWALMKGLYYSCNLVSLSTKI